MSAQPLVAHMLMHALLFALLQVQRDKKTRKPLMEDGKARILTSHTLNPVCPPSALCKVMDRLHRLMPSAYAVCSSALHIRHIQLPLPVLVYHDNHCAMRLALLPYMLFVDVRMPHRLTDMSHAHACRCR